VSAAAGPLKPTSAGRYGVQGQHISRPRYPVLRRGSRSKQRHKRAPATNLEKVCATRRSLKQDLALTATRAIRYGFVPRSSPAFAAAALSRRTLFTS
jgi:hypothetical protein